VIAALDFGPPERSDGRCVRRIAFRRRSALPLSAVCLVANGVREVFGQLLARELDAEVLDPVVLEAGASCRLFDQARVKRVRGRLCDVFVALRPDAARALVGAAFGEAERSTLPFSEIERATLDRMLGALSPLCVPLCGSVRGAAAEDAERAARETTTSFEVRFRGAVGAALTFGLSADPAEEVVAGVSVEDLADVGIECVVECAGGPIALSALAALRVGMTIPLRTTLDAPGMLRAGGIPFVRGTCGTRGERAAFVVEGGAARSAA
jgi:hypothetical protein